MSHLTREDFTAARDAACSVFWKAYFLVRDAKEGRHYLRTTSTGLVIDERVSWVGVVEKFCGAMEGSWEKIDRVREQLACSRSADDPVSHGQHHYATAHELAWNYARQVWCAVRDVAYSHGPLADEEDPERVKEIAAESWQHSQRKDFWLDPDRVREYCEPTLDRLRESIEPIDSDRIHAWLKIEATRAIGQHGPAEETAKVDRLKMTQEEANAAAMELAEKNGEPFLGGSMRKWAEAIRAHTGRDCSDRLVGHTPMWQKTMKRTGRGRKKGTVVSPPRAVSLTDEVEAQAGEGEPHEMLKKLVAEQTAEELADKASLRIRKKL